MPILPNTSGRVCIGRLLIAFPLACGLPTSFWAKSSIPSVRLHEDGPESRAIAFLAREVPLWSVTNKCFSCHNNGDAARALYTAKRLGYPITADALADTTDWLSHPDRWNDNGGDGPFNNKRLARIQFTAALQSATESGSVFDSEPLVQAASLLANEQDEDGSWSTDAVAALGSPATYGRALSTWIARDSLRAAERKRFARHVERADRWLQRMEIQNIMDAAIVLLASAESSDLGWRKPRVDAFALLLKGQSDDGGWGPFSTAAPEPFDTALVLLALARNIDSLNCRPIINRGREFLIANQHPDGSWTETTRPAGSESYAQRISTTGWATLALLITR